MSRLDTYDHDNVIMKTKTSPKLKRPSMYRVIMLNDDFTTFEFVETVLQKIFRKTLDEAKVISLEVHKSGKAVAGGPYTLEVAETKVLEAMDYAKQHEHPLMLKVEENS